jgi:hypothetical protein
MTEDSDLQQLQTAHPKDMTKGMSRILAYRLLDIGQWLTESSWTPPASPVLPQDTTQNFVGSTLLNVMVRLYHHYYNVIPTGLLGSNTITRLDQRRSYCPRQH